MATTSEIPTLDRILDSIVARLSPEVVAALAAMRPAAGRPRSDDSLADELIRMAQVKARARLDSKEKAGPLADEPEFDEETRRVLAEMREGVNVKRYEKADDFFAAHGF